MREIGQKEKVMKRINDAERSVRVDIPLATWECGPDITADSFAVDDISAPAADISLAYRALADKMQTVFFYSTEETVTAIVQRAMRMLMASRNVVFAALAEDDRLNTDLKVCVPDGVKHD